MKHLLLLLLITFGAYAQNEKLTIKPELASKGGGGGRDFEVATISQKILVEENFLKIKKFFLNHAELTYDFPEINISKLTQKIDELTIEITDKKLYDQYGVESTALNFPSLNIIKYNSTKLKSLLTKPELFFVLNFHELLGLLGIEESNPSNESIVDSYPISSRLVKYVSKINSYDLVFYNLSDGPAVSKKCKKTMADWLNSHYSNERKEIIINRFCSNFKGDLEVVTRCLDVTYNWVTNTEVDFKYAMAFLTCSNVKKKFLGSEIGARTVRCLRKEWKNHSYIFDGKERRLTTAKVCSNKI